MPSTRSPAALAPALTATLLAAAAGVATAQPPLGDPSLPRETLELAGLGRDTAPPAPQRQPIAATSDRERPLIIRGLRAMMTGWHRVEALVSDRRIDRVEWQVNGRRYPSSERLTAELYFGTTPQPRKLEALAYDREGVLRYTTATTVNAGGSAHLLDYVSPLAGRDARGPTEIELCAYAPPDRPIDRVLIRHAVAGSEPPAATLADAIGRGGCRQGAAYRAIVELTPDPTVITAELYTRPRAADAEPDRPQRPRLERSIALNMPPAVEETVEVRLLEWPVQVFDRRQPVTELGAEDFVLHEDRRQCAIERVLTLDHVPFRLAMVFDWSASTALDAGAEAAAAVELLDHLFDPRKDSVMIEGVAHTPIRYLGWTGEEELVRSALERIRYGYRLAGNTALYDTLVEVLYEFQSESDHGLPAVVLLTDGLDTGSREFSREQALAYARESGVPIYPIAVQVRIDGRRQTRTDIPFLAALAEESGGALHSIELDGRPAKLRERAASLRDEAESLRREPGDLAADPRFLDHLVTERQAEATELEARASRLERNNAAPLAEIRRVFTRVKRDLSSGYVLVARSQAPRSDRWHRVQVEIAHAEGRGSWQVRAPRGLHW